MVHHALIPPPPEPLINIVGQHSKADACRWDWGRGHMPVCTVNLVVCQLSAGRWWMHSGNILGVWAMSFSLKSFGTLIEPNMATLKIKLYVYKQGWILNHQKTTQKNACCTKKKLDQRRFKVNIIVPNEEIHVVAHVQRPTYRQTTETRTSNKQIKGTKMLGWVVGEWDGAVGTGGRQEGH